ncbi:MAG: hypothetical protein JXR95_12195 [Deltaproteobacteria bacterium]|nr:hypothetical protein [Deltaproteobacteria bacterium]
MKKLFLVLFVILGCSGKTETWNVTETVKPNDKSSMSSSPVLKPVLPDDKIETYESKTVIKDIAIPFKVLETEFKKVVLSNNLKYLMISAKIEKTGIPIRRFRPFIRVRALSGNQWYFDSIALPEIGGSLEKKSEIHEKIFRSTPLKDDITAVELIFLYGDQLGEEEADERIKIKWNGKSIEQSVLRGFKSTMTDTSRSETDAVISGWRLTAPLQLAVDIKIRAPLAPHQAIELIVNKQIFYVSSKISGISAGDVVTTTVKIKGYPLKMQIKVRDMRKGEKYSKAVCVDKNLKSIVCEK